MITLALDDEPWLGLDLIPEARQTMGGSEVGPGLPNGLISFQGPISIPLTKERVTDDSMLRQFVEAQSKHFVFHLVHMACTFRPQRDEPFVSAWLKVELRRTDGNTEPDQAPIALSMSPLRLVKPHETVQKRDVGLGFQFPAMISINLGYGDEDHISGEDPFLEALFELSSHPSWEFTRLEGMSILGLYRFALVVRMPKDTVTQGEITLGASVERKYLKIFPYQAAFPNAPKSSFLLA